MSNGPYIGLRPFNSGEADIFFGRDVHINQLLNNIAQQHFTTITGLSGCGKSSLIHAGIIPRLQMGALTQAGVYWRIITMRPRNDPFTKLSEALLDKNAIGNEYQTLFKDTKFTKDGIKNHLKTDLRNSYNLQEVLETLHLPKENNFLLIVDQFEEIFKLRNEKTNKDKDVCDSCNLEDKNPNYENIEQATAFVNFLLKTSEEQSNVYILIAMRSEYIGECAKFYKLAEKINETLFLVPRLTRLQLQESIESPIHVYDGEIEDSLVQQILNDANNEPDQLPLIQHILRGMWRKTKIEKGLKTAYGIEINPKYYDEYGGLKHSLSRHIENVYNSLEHKTSKLIVEYLFRNLVEVDEALPNMRRYAKLGYVFELTKHIAKQKFDQDILFSDIVNIVEEFRRKGRRFLEPRIEDEETLTEDSIISVTHESIIRHWSRMKEWHEKEVFYFELYCNLEKNYGLWEKSQQKKDELLTGAILFQAKEWLKKEYPSEIWVKRYDRRKNIDFGSLIQYIELSDSEIERKKEEEKKKLQERIRHYEKEFQLQAKQTKLDKEKLEIAEKNRLAIEKDLRSRIRHNEKEAKLKAYKAELEKEKREVAEKERKTTKSALALVIVFTGFLVYYLFELDETYQNLDKTHKDLKEAQIELIDSKEERTQNLFDARISQSIFQIRNNQFNSAHKSLEQNKELAKEKILKSSQHAYGLMQGYIDLFGQTSLEMYSEFNFEIYSIAPVNQGFIVGGKAGQWGHFNIAEKRFTPYPKLDSDVNAIAICESLNWIVTGDGSGKVTIWKQEEQPSIIAHYTTKSSIRALAATKTQLIAGDKKGKLHYWDISEQGLKLTDNVQAHQAQIALGGLSLSSDNTLLISVSYDKTAKLWDIQNPQEEPIQTVSSSDSEIFQATFSPNTQLIATANADKSISLFDVDGTKISSLRGHQGAISSVQFSDDNLYLFSGSQDSNIMLWDVETGKHLQTLHDHQADITQLLLADNQLWSSSIDGSIRSWKLALPYKLIETCQPSICPSKFDPTLTDKQRTYRKHPLSAAISPQGKHIVVGFLDGTLSLYSLPEVKLLQEFTAHQAKILSLSFNQKGSLVASAGSDKTAKLWELQENNLVEKQKIEAESKLSNVAFSPDATTLAIASFNGKISLYQPEQASSIQTFELYETHALSVNFMNNKQLLIAGDNKAQLLNLDTGEKTLIDQSKPFSWMTGIAYSSQTNYFATYGLEKILRIFDKDFEQIHQIVAHNDTIYKSLFSPDGNQIASLSTNGVIKLWDLATDKQDKQLFSIQLPVDTKVRLEEGSFSAIYDFDFHCTPTGCWIVAPMLHGRIAVYHFGDIYNND